MKNKIFFQLFLISWLLSAAPIVLFAQNASTQGTDFWFAFMNNNDDDPSQTCLILSAQRACSVTVSNPNTGWQTTANIPAGGRIDVNIPLAQGYHSSSTDGVIYNLGCHLTATDTISAYSMNYRNASFDGGHLLPTSTLGDEYMIETIPPGLNGSTILLVGTENGTQIEVTPTAPLSNGWAANTSNTLTLNAGQIIQLTTTSATASLSGTRVRTLNCEKIAVFAGSKCAQAPAGCTYCDHIYDPMIPVIYWGNHFALTASLTRSMDVVRVTALNDGTVVTRDGIIVATLAAGGTYDFQLTSSSSYIETTGPAVCYLYLTGQSCGGGTGDPSMIYIAPIEQNIKKITFGTYEYAGTTTNHYVNIVTPTDNVNSVRLDGNNISGQFTRLTGNPTYSFARLSISHATHTLQCDSGLVAHVYGLYNVTSYGYSVGSSAVNLRNSVLINNVYAADIPENYNYCPFRPIDFEVELNYNYNSISWDFGDGSGTANTNPCTYAYDSSGVFTVTVVVERVGATNCYGTNFDTLRATVTVPPLQPVPIYQTICGGGSYNFNGTVLTEPGIYRDTLDTGSECDSIIELHLSFVPAEPIPIYHAICPGASYNFNGTEYYDEGIYRDTIPTAGGCDSIVELHLSFANNPAVSLGNDRVLCGSEQFPVVLSTNYNGANISYVWSTGATSSTISVGSAGTYSVTVTDANGCTGTNDIEIRLQDAINAEITITADFCEAGSTELVVTTNAPNVQWSTGESTPTILATHAGTYTVRAYDGPCQSSAAVELLPCPFNLYFPNCITRSFDDGKNDVFHLSNPEIVSDFEIFIYNKWGILIYHSTDPYFQWDGSLNGKIAVNNIFTWAATAAPLTETKKRSFRGTLLVL